MGILDDKKRFFDTILTDEGRRQLGAGRFKPAFYSFSDAGAVYSVSSGSVSSVGPVSLEACPLPQDQVAYEADDSGGLRVFGNNNYFHVPSGSAVRVISGHLVRGYDQLSGSVLEVLTSSAEFASMATAVLSDAPNNFRKLMILKSPDLLYTNRDNFVLSTGSITFRITDETTNLPGGVTSNTIEAVEDMFSNKKLSHLDNFQFLPPVNKATSTAIGNYAEAVNGNRKILSYQDLMAEFQNTVVNQSGSVQHRSVLQRETVKFSETSITNRVVGQVFEIAGGRVLKLDVVDFGVFLANPTLVPPLFPEAVPQPLNPDLVSAITKTHVYFVGKVILDANGNDKFVNIMSLVFG